MKSHRKWRIQSKLDTKLRWRKGFGGWRKFIEIKFMDEWKNIR